MRDDNLARRAPRAGMLNRHRLARVGAAAAVFHIRGHRRVALGSALARQTPADHAAIRGITGNLNLEHLACFEDQLEDFPILRDWR
jgi:hypothetical protein